uniref:CDP-diacylglycerol--glycerol-3-phosphate 3-phosphatidyltransferase n=1 Tax=Plectus sambesii TaxID=2011161 RepID=A0A914V7U8_9BILA
MTVLDWLGEYSPRISVPSSNIQVLNYPNDFYSMIKKLMWTSHKRITLAALYVEQGELEEELVSTLRNTLATADERFQVRILLDALRGSRGGEKSSTALLQDLVDEYSGNDRFQVHLYHTPDLRGIMKKVLPERFDESIGVQHMKLYIFDDTLLISGANLSESYFTNRQDRYVVINDCPLLADFYANIVEAVARSCFTLEKGGKTVLHEQCHVHPYLGDHDAYCKMIRERVNGVVDTFKENLADTPNTDSETVIYPLVQMAPIGIDIEDRVLHRFFASNFDDMPNASVYLATGYFNLTSDYSSVIVDRGSYNLTVVSASPLANDFYACDGFTGDVPALYTHSSRKFYDQIAKKGRSDNINMYEYAREGWTFHAKGLWWDSDPADPDAICATFVGSSNYGYRSAYRDIEAQVVIVTRNAKLREQLTLERGKLFQHASEVTLSTFQRVDHHVACWIRVIYKCIRSFF